MRNKGLIGQRPFANGLKNPQTLSVDHLNPSLSYFV
jgi:hypothetical protein